MLTVHEILTAAGKDIDTIMPHAGNKYLRMFISAAVIPAKKFVLPDGNPPHKQADPKTYQAEGAFWQMAKRVDIFSRADLKPARREMLFIQALEALPSHEQQILLLAKDQNLHLVFPKVTYDNLVAVGYFK